jgi:TPR repeat protein
LARNSGEFIDLTAIARLLDDLGHTEKASQLYHTCLQADLPPEVYHDTLYRLALLHKHSSDYATAIPLWEIAASHRRLYAFEELAKYYEHHALDLEKAHKWTIEALDFINSANTIDPETKLWKQNFEHRLQRLKRKISKQVE